MWPQYLCCVWTYSFSLGNVQPETALAKIRKRIQKVRCVLFIVAVIYMSVLHLVTLTAVSVSVSHDSSHNADFFFLNIPITFLTLYDGYLRFRGEC